MTQTSIIPKQTLILNPSQVAKLDQKIKQRIATNVSHFLTRHIETMLQKTPEELISIMEKNLAMAIVDANTCSIISFCRFSIMPGTNYQGQQVWELCSWLTDDGYKGRGYGRAILHSASSYVNEINKDQQNNILLLAVVAPSNYKAQLLLYTEGGVRIPGPKNVDLMLTVGKKDSICIDITNLCQSWIQQR